MVKSIQKSLYVDKPLQKAIDKLVKHTDQNAETKAIKIAIVNYPDVVKELDTTQQILDELRFEYRELIRLLNQKKRIEDEISKYQGE